VRGHASAGYAASRCTWIALACRLLRARRRAADQRDELAAPHGAHPNCNILASAYLVNRKLDVASPRCFPQCIKLRRRRRVIGEGRHAATAPSSPLDRDRMETK